MGNKLKPMYFAVTPISAVEGFLGNSAYEVWIPDGTAWRRIETMPETFSPADGFAVVATTAKVLNIAGARKLGGPLANFGGSSDGNPWPDPPPLTANDETIESYATRGAGEGIRAAS